jgi:hypothetical protein
MMQDNEITLVKRGRGRPRKIVDEQVVEVEQVVPDKELKELDKIRLEFQTMLDQRETLMKKETETLKESLKMAQDAHKQEIDTLQTFVLSLNKQLSEMKEESAANKSVSSSLKRKFVLLDLTESPKKKSETNKNQNTNKARSSSHSPSYSPSSPSYSPSSPSYSPSSPSFSESCESEWE